MKPTKSYTIWFSQRCGSTLLCQALKSTGKAGNPGEHFLRAPGESLLKHFDAVGYAALQQKIWDQGMSDNGVFGIKINAPLSEADPNLMELRKLPSVSKVHATNFTIWENVFPHGKHIFLTRRNKVRQAVSWWKAIVTNEWHRQDQPPLLDRGEIEGKYDFEAIRHLLIEINIMESSIQAFLDQGEVVPLTLVYEDFVREYDATIKTVLTFLGLDAQEYNIESPYLVKMADEVSDAWVERFRIEMQAAWKSKRW